MWTAEVVLSDGGTALVRSLGPQDRPGLEAFYAGVSEPSRYFRFLAAHPALTERDLDRMTGDDPRRRHALALDVDEEIIGVGEYEVVADAAGAGPVANVAFMVADAHQGRGAGHLLLEHLAHVGRLAGVRRFVAEMLPSNRRMLRVFTRAGYQVHPDREDDLVVVDIDLSPTPATRAVMERRGAEADAAAVRRLLTPERVALVGDDPATRAVAASLAAWGFGGEVVHVPDAAALTAPVDLVLARVPFGRLETLMARVDACGGHALVGLAGDGTAPLRAAEVRQVVAWGRRHDLRVLGPESVGLVNASGGVRLNATPAAGLRPGVVGLFTESAGVGILLLGPVVARGLGLANFTTGGAFADISAATVVRYWGSDAGTRVGVLSLDVVPQPRGLVRALRAVAPQKPVVVFRPARAVGRAAGESLPAVPASGIDRAVERVGALVVQRRPELLDAALLLARQPRATGRRVLLVSNSGGVLRQMRAAAGEFGLEPVTAPVVHEHPVAAGLVATAHGGLTSGEVDAVVVTVVEVAGAQLAAVRTALADLARDARRPLLGVFVGLAPPGGSPRGEYPPDEPDGPGQLAEFASYADALTALARTVADGPPPSAEPEDPDPDAAAAARALVAQVLATHPEGRELTRAECAHLLALRGVHPIGSVPVADVDAAVAAAASLDWWCVLKPAASWLRGRPELDELVRRPGDAEGVRRAWAALETAAARLGVAGAAALEPVVQELVPGGVAMRVRAVEERSLGPMVAVAPSGALAAALGDEAWRLAPVDDAEARRMLGELRSASLLAGGPRPVHVEGMAELIVALGRLTDDVPALVEVELDPVLSGPDGTWVLGARARVVPRPADREPAVRSAG